jgi:hypothetical protein
LNIPSIEECKVQASIRGDVMKGNVQALDDVGFKVDTFLCGKLL